MGLEPVEMGDAGRWSKVPDPVVETITVMGHRIVTYSYGEGEEVLLLLNGGPGLPCEYMRVPHAPLAGRGYRVVSFDQLGTGASDRPRDRGLWTIERYAREVEAVREAMNLGRVHLAGHSWGGWLAIEYAARYGENLKSLILQNTCADIPHLVSELGRLRDALGPETGAMMLAHEAAGDFEHPAYKGAITVLNYRHVCRLDHWPEPFTRSIGDSNREIYNIMQGPNEFLYTGNLRDWSRLDDLAEVKVPVLILVGAHDEITPGCALHMRKALSSAEVAVFPNSAHVPFYEEPDAFLARLTGFLDGVTGRAERAA
ncbi:proline iminopeptidase-family hydrolase [Pelagibius sp. CAU 1746]|uniref:proline iminopeptidase-family hydrolase n=1 Tax=Pelagibius sp. CAU 1746 TaxID=3140370 RepID=UPI00325BE462